MTGVFVNRVETRSGNILPAIVVQAGFQEARHWQAQVHRPFIGTDLSRLDRNWHWPAYFLGCTTHEWLLRRRVAYMQIQVRTPSGEAFPVGQVLLSDGYPYIASPGVPCIFVWFLTSTPPRALTKHGIPSDIKVLKPLVDVAIQLSYQSGYNGRIALHAGETGDAAADQELLDKYHFGVGMELYGHGPMPFSSVMTGRVSGRMLYCSELKALDLSNNLDYLRV